MSNSNKPSNPKEIVFFIDKEQFKTDLTEITAADLLTMFAEEDPKETTLVLKHGNETSKYEDDTTLIPMHNGMQFVVFYDGPTTVSYYGPEVLIADLQELGYQTELLSDGNNHQYAVIRNYTIQLGKFAGKVIDLAIPAPSNFPQSVGASIHVRAKPQLYEKSDSVPNVRNIIDSNLGPEWLYWSKNFNWGQQKQTTRRLMALIAGVFEDA